MTQKWINVVDNGSNKVQAMNTLVLLPLVTDFLEVTTKAVNGWLPDFSIVLTMPLEVLLRFQAERLYSSHPFEPERTVFYETHHPAKVPSMITTHTLTSIAIATTDMPHGCTLLLLNSPQRQDAWV